MIAIVNVGMPNNSDRQDKRMYEVRINHKVLFSFMHNRDDGLAVCLSKACAAAYQYEKLINIVGDKQQ